MANLDYKRLEVRYQSGVIASYPIDASKLQLGQTEFIQDSYVSKMKPGVAVTIGSEGYIKPAGTSNDEVILGFLVNDLAGYPNQNMNGIATGMASVLIGGGNVFIIDNVKDEDITVGSKLYVGSDGILTKTEGTKKGAVAIALSSNSASNKALIIQTI